VFDGKRVNRLTDELQLIYIASSWVGDLARSPKISAHPSHLASLLDAIYLLKASKDTLDWERVLDWLGDDMETVCLHITLTYLRRRGLGQFDPSVLSRLAARQHLVRALELRFIHAMLDRYLIGGRYWDLPIPPPFAPGRYNLRRQWQRRVVGPLLGRR